MLPRTDYSKIGIIGFGNMGAALAKGLLQGKHKPELFAYNRSPSKNPLIKKMGAVPCDSAVNVVLNADIIILAAKPVQIRGIIQEITPQLSDKKILVSIAAGLTISQLGEACENMCPVVRVMPNTHVKTKHGLLGLCFDDLKLNQMQKENLRQIFESTGTCFEVAENKMNAYSALAGCGPAYVYYFAEALIEAGVTMGFTRKDSTNMAYALFSGCVQLAEKEQIHPSLLREQVCSPGGMTIAGTNTLDAYAVRNSIVKAVLAAKSRADDMGKE